jgi:hypothetical protein
MVQGQGLEYCYFGKAHLYGMTAAIAATQLLLKLQQ